MEALEAAPPHLRCPAASLGYNISFGVISGLTPLVAAWLLARTGDEIAPAFLIIVSAAATLVAIVSFRETYRASFRRPAARAESMIGFGRDHRISSGMRGWRGKNPQAKDGPFNPSTPRSDGN